MINIEDFSKLDLRVGTILKAEILEKAKTPAYYLEIDFGNMGIRHSSAQITDLYTPQDLIGKQIVSIINLPPKKIAGKTSEVLVLGANSNNNKVVLLSPQREIPNGAKIS